MILVPIEQAESVPGLVLVIVLAVLAWFIIAILLCVWVYRDAESRGMSGVLWLIVVIIGSVIGLIVYLIVRKEKGPPIEKITRVCTSCGRAISPGVKFCPHCGKEIPE